MQTTWRNAWLFWQLHNLIIKATRTAFFRFWLAFYNVESEFAAAISLDTKTRVQRSNRWEKSWKALRLTRRRMVTRYFRCEGERSWAWQDCPVQTGEEHQGTSTSNRSEDISVRRRQRMGDGLITSSWNLDICQSLLGPLRSLSHLPTRYWQSTSIVVKKSGHHFSRPLLFLGGSRCRGSAANYVSQLILSDFSISLSRWQIPSFYPLKTMSSAVALDTCKETMSPSRSLILLSAAKHINTRYKNLPFVLAGLRGILTHKTKPNNLPM